MSSGHQRIKWRRDIAENFNRLSMVHERYRQTTDRRQTDRQTDRRQTDGRRHIANMNMSSRSLKNAALFDSIAVAIFNGILMRCLIAHIMHQTHTCMQ